MERLGLKYFMGYCMIVLYIELSNEASINSTSSSRTRESLPNLIDSDKLGKIYFIFGGCRAQMLTFSSSHSTKSFFKILILRKKDGLEGTS